MGFKILITGAPRCGKSTLISKLINELKDEKSLFGFLTPEIRKKGRRIGFDLQDINSGKRRPLARKGNYDSDYKLGSYHVFIEQFNQYLKNNIVDTLNLGENSKRQDRVLIIDEIGKMELFSEIFQSNLKKVFSSDISVIATIGKYLKHPLKDFIINLPDIKCFSLSRKNQKMVISEILNLLN